MTTLSPVGVAEVAMAAGFKAEKLPIAVAVSFAEVRNHDTNAHNSHGEDSWGLWQLNCAGKLWHDRQQLAAHVGISLHHPSDLVNANWNGRLARALSERDGWHIWSTYADRAYLKHMSAALAAIAAVTSGRVTLTRYLLEIGDSIDTWQSGHDVALWQHVAGTKVDGWFGPLTKAATQRWQSEHHDIHGRRLVADGIVGPLTSSAAGWLWSPR